MASGNPSSLPGAGIADLGQVRKGLEGKRKKLFLPRGELPAVNRALLELKKARDAKRQVSLRSEEWQSHDIALNQAKEKKKSVDGQLDALRTHLHRLTRIHDALPSIARRKGLLTELEAYADAAILTPDFGERHRSIGADLRLAEDRERRAVSRAAQGPQCRERDRDCRAGGAQCSR